MITGKIMAEASQRFTAHLTPLQVAPKNAMSPAELAKILTDLDLAQTAGARLIGVTDRTMRRWCAGDVPIPMIAARFLRYLVRTGASPIRVMETLL